MNLIEELRSKKSRDNRELLDSAADRIEELEKIVDAIPKQLEVKQYVKCSHCGKKLYFGEKVLTKPNYCGVYCSPNCFAQSFNIGCCSTPLTKEFAFRKDCLVKTEVVLKGDDAV